jgi:ElaB/YqjD/DUF883 family membrane-anchored ribosome-binding protein
MTKTSEKNEATDDLEAVRQDIEALRKDLASLTKSLKGAGESGLEKIAAAGSAKAQELEGGLEQAMDTLRSQGQVSVAQIERAIHDKPLTSLLAAFGAGMLIARLLERR